MISEEDKQRYIEATKCKDCLGWHHHCHAECCKTIFLIIDPKELDKPGKYYTMTPKESLGLGQMRYYQLRDVEYTHGVLRFRKDRIIVVGRKVMYIYPCKLLKGNLCSAHSGVRPEICKLLTEETARAPGMPFQLTDNCLFKYKCKEVKENDQEKESTDEEGS